MSILEYIIPKKLREELPNPYPITAERIDEHTIKYSQRVDYLPKTNWGYYIMKIKYWLKS